MELTSGQHHVPLVTEQATLSRYSLSLIFDKQCDQIENYWPHFVSNKSSQSISKLFVLF